MIARQGNTDQDCDFAPVINDCDAVVSLPASFHFHDGSPAPAHLHYRLTGPENAPVILVLGGISADRNAMDAGDGHRGWWRDFSGPGKAVDTEKYQILSFDYMTAKIATGQQIPAVSTLDQARALDHLLDCLDIVKIACFIGSSYGGMIGLAFAVAYPERLDHLIAISAGDYPHPMATARRSIQRQTVQLGLKAGFGTEALALARQLAMTTYRSPEEFSERFSTTPDQNRHFPVENYLMSRGRRFIERMSPQRFLMLSLSIDLHQVDATAIRVPTTLVASTSDQIVPINQMQALARKISAPCQLREIQSLYGHDAFLLEINSIQIVINKTLEELFA